ncbi:hypothetical protein TSOC_001821 [Tetrabaena socialis]|uniref:Uncharacterized protein n=1 Tax=Tetrabaena socialis TaxID=47790 RepID=A0A2J8AFU1_9CHLO|nr:hypothetical protein TSOC_001821 [Tetrabaena socialis]|eukprot:PNH11391.1 hypothetical protein TSOC_001821 [Tetrabaena socialis]
MPTVALATAIAAASASLPPSAPSASSRPPSAPSAAATAPELARGAIFNGGVHHPGRGGHVVTTELLITLAQDLLLADERLAAAMAAAPQTNGSDVSSDAGGREGGDYLSGAVRLLSRVAYRPLPPPLSDGNYEAAPPTCFIGQELQALVRQPAPGWSWTDEGRGKWGWVALEAHQQLRIQGSRERSLQPVAVQIAYLQSYAGMGMVQVFCESGCSCEAIEVDGFSERKVSVTYMRELLVSQHPQCVLVLVTTGPGRDRPFRGGRKAADAGEEEGVSRGDKFKLMGLVVSKEPSG